MESDIYYKEKSDVDHDQDDSKDKDFDQLQKAKSIAQDGTEARYIKDLIRFPMLMRI